MYHHIDGDSGDFFLIALLFEYPWVAYFILVFVSLVCGSVYLNNGIKEKCNEDNKKCKKEKKKHIGGGAAGVVIAIVMICVFIWSKTTEDKSSSPRYAQKIANEILDTDLL